MFPERWYFLNCDNIELKRTSNFFFCFQTASLGGSALTLTLFFGKEFACGELWRVMRNPQYPAGFGSQLKFMLKQPTPWKLDLAVSAIFVFSISQPVTSFAIVRTCSVFELDFKLTFSRGLILSWETTCIVCFVQTSLVCEISSVIYSKVISLLKFWKMDESKHPIRIFLITSN